MITQYSFGKMCINGIWYQRDLQINGVTVLPDWWRKNGHECRIEDLDEILAGRPDILILGQGKPGLMRATDELKRYLRQHDIQLIQQPTTEAVATFNGLYREKKVAAGFHLTC